MSHSIRSLAAAAALTFNALASQAAQIDINGDVTQRATMRNSAVSSVATGVGSTADAGVNVIKGKVKVGGSVKQTADLSNSAVSAVAVGAAARASAGVNTIEGK
jgi:hypothetical protein